MNNEKEMAALNTSVGADTGQPFNVISNNSITNKTTDFNSFDENQQKIRRMLDPSYLKTISMTELYDTVYLSKPPLINGLLYPGTYLFVGAPKVGKSFLMAQIAYHISTGIPLWNYPIQKGTVLYLALEDNYSRLQKRLYQMFGTESTEDLYFSVSAGQLGNGLDEQLRQFLYEHSNTKLIIIDTLQKVREIGGDNYSYANDYQIITKLKWFADSYGLCLLLVHHTRKQAADDKFDMISGTTGLLGAADGAFLLSKEKRIGNTATLDVAGRDQMDMRISLVRNENTLAWELKSAETELWKPQPEPLLDEVAKHINAENSLWVGSPSELVAFLGVNMRANTLSMKLNINASRLLDQYSIHYQNMRYHSGRKIRLTFNGA